MVRYAPPAKRIRKQKKQKGTASMTTMVTDELWPALPYDAWQDTYATLHMWTQVVGKVALAQAPPLNHSWSIALQVTARGLSTRALPHRHRTFTIQFDFIDHQLVILASDGETRTLALRPQTVADFYREVMAALDGMGLPVKIWPMPVEIPSPIRFDQDTVHRSYDPVVREPLLADPLADRACARRRRSARSSASAAPFTSSGAPSTWRSTRFSGRPAPPREGPAFMREAYSHEVISHGFWPGGGPLPEPVFYAYAAPEPPGFKEARVSPEVAYYHRELGEFILPYDVVRSAASPDQAILTFVETTYDRAATLAGWDRAALDRARPARADG